MITTMVASILRTLAILAVMCSICLAETRMEFSTTPNVITEGITKSVQMTCSLNEMSKRADFSPEDIQTVSTMSIANAEGKNIANIHGESANVLINKGGLTATGSLTGHAHLDLTFSDPDAMDTGVYKCQMIGYSTTHRTIILEQSWQVKTKNPRINDVLARMETQENAISDQQKTISDQQKAISNLQQKLSKCSAKVVFSAFRSNLNAIRQADTVVYAHTKLNQGNDYNNSTGVFTCRVPGLYKFMIHGQAASNTPDKGNLWLMLLHNTNAVGELFAYNSKDDLYNAASATALVQLKAGDTVRVKPDRYFEFTRLYNHDYVNSFQGYLIQADGCQS